MGSWGYFIQGSDQQLEVDELGSILSLVLDCAVHYPAYGKNLFECTHGAIFPLFAVRGAANARDWSQIKERHNPVEPEPIPVAEDQLLWRGQVAMKKASE